MQQSLRRYLTKTELQERSNISSVDTLTLIQAEQDIDNILATRYQGYYRQFLVYEHIFDNITLTATTATLNGATATNGYFAYTTLEILSGNFAGNKYAVKNNTNNVLTFWDTNTGLTGNAIGKVYQTGKAPFDGGSLYTSNTYFKSIDERIKQAVAFQYEFRNKNSKMFEKIYSTTSYLVDQDRYSENFDTQNKITIEQRISPQAIDILEGLTSQTL